MINSRLQPYLCPLFVTLLCLLPSLLPEAAQSLLEYRRSAILSGELWRMLSGHLTHLNPPHLLMNLAGLWLIWWLFPAREASSASCRLELPLLLLGTSAALLLFSPELTWYRGLSGALHGLLSLMLLQQWQRHPRFSALLLLLLCAKLLWEQTAGPVPGSASWISGRVIVDSHLYGAICGSIIWLLERSHSLLNKREVTG